jgi:hypothetical protein
MSRLIVILETDNRQFATARHAFTQRLEVVRRCLMDGVTSGVLVTTPESRVHGAWLLEIGEGDES